MRGRVIAVGILLVLALGVALSIGLPGADENDDPIAVGVVYNTSGGMKWLDAPGLEGLQLAVREINDSGGVSGRPLGVVEVDGTTDITEMTHRVGDLTTRDDLVAIVGVNDPIHAVAPIRGALRRADGGLITFSHSEMALAVGRVSGPAGMPFVTAGSTLSRLPQMVEDVFMIASDHQSGAEAIADYGWDELGGKSAFILVDEGHRYTTDLGASFETRWELRGGEIVGSGSYSAGQLDISAQIGTARALTSPPDVIFVASLTNDGGYLVRQLRDAGLSQPILFADVADPRYIAAMAGDMDGVHMSTHGSLIDPDQAIQGFIDAFENEHGHAPGSPSALLGYDAMRLTANAIERAGSVDTRALSESFGATDFFDALSGSMSYTEPNGPLEKTITIVSYDATGPRIAAKVEPS